MKLVKNNVARLITLNRHENKEVKSIKLIPAEPGIEVEDKFLDSAFAKALIKCGDISVEDIDLEFDEESSQESTNRSKKK